MNALSVYVLIHIIIYKLKLPKIVLFVSYPGKELHDQLQFECEQMSNDEDDQDLEGAYAEYEDQLNEIGK